MTIKTLHAALYHRYHAIWIEHHIHFEFTKRIKYVREHGDFTKMLLEIAWEEKERNWYSFWKKTTYVFTKWVDSDNFDYKYPHKKSYDSDIVDCA